MLNKIKKFLKSLFKRKDSDHIKKSSTYQKDVLLGQLQVLQATDLRVGVKVLGFQGLAHIKEIKNHPWIRIKYHHGRGADHENIKLLQYFFSVHNHKKNITTVYPLSFADYEYIDPCEADIVIRQKGECWLEGHITNKGYFQLIKDVKQQREHLTVINESGQGRDTWRKLKSKNLLTKIK